MRCTAVGKAAEAVGPVLLVTSALLGLDERALVTKMRLVYACTTAQGTSSSDCVSSTHQPGRLVEIGRSSVLGGPALASLRC